MKYRDCQTKLLHCNTPDQNHQLKNDRKSENSQPSDPEVRWLAPVPGRDTMLTPCYPHTHSLSLCPVSVDSIRTKSSSQR